MQLVLRSKLRDGRHPREPCQSSLRELGRNRTVFGALGYFGPKRFVRTLSARITLSKALSAQLLRPSPHQKGRNLTLILLGGPLGRPFFLFATLPQLV